METIDKIIIDTDICVDYLRGRSRVLEKLIFSLTISITSISVFELRKGALLSSKKEKRLQEVESLISEFEVLEFGSNEAKIAADIDVELQSSGFMIDIRDLLIASVCLSNNLPLLTGNPAHFKKVKGLKLFAL